MICWQFPLVGWQERKLMMKVSTMTHCLSIQKMPLNLWKFKHSFPSCYIHRMWLPLQNSKLCVLCKGIGSHCVKEFLAFIQMHLHAYLYVSLFKNLFFYCSQSFMNSSFILAFLNALIFFPSLQHGCVSSFYSGALLYLPFDLTSPLFWSDLSVDKNPYCNYLMFNNRVLR